MSILSLKELDAISMHLVSLRFLGSDDAKKKLIYDWAKSGHTTCDQHILLSRWLYQDQTSEPVNIWVPPPSPHTITVSKDGKEVFRTVRGNRPKDYPLRDFTCFASPIIGAAYHYLSFIDAASRIESQGYTTEFTFPDITG